MAEEQGLMVPDIVVVGPDRALDKPGSKILSDLSVGTIARRVFVEGGRNSPAYWRCEGFTSLKEVLVQLTDLQKKWVLERIVEAEVQAKTIDSLRARIDLLEERLRKLEKMKST